MRTLWPCVLMLLLPSMVFGQYAVGDRGSLNSGNWGNAATWGTWNGTTWTSGGGVPGTTARVHVRSGHTVLLDGSGTAYMIQDLLVEAGAKLWTANTLVNRYITIRGTTLRCNGRIGDGNTFDGISFNFDGPATTIDGSGQFDASRLRKYSPTTMTAYQTDLTIDIDVRLRFQASSTAQIYNNQDGNNIFNVTVAAGRTVELTGSGGTGHLAIDGIDGASSHARGGTVTVNGTLLIPGTLYLTTNNSAGNPACGVVINAGGHLRAHTVNASTSGAAGHQLTVNDGGTLEITGSPGWSGWSTTNNTYILGSNSTTMYSGSAGQDVRPLPSGYGNLVIGGNGNKTLAAATLVKGNLTIGNASGSPVLDVTASNHQITVQGDWTSYGANGFNERTGTVVFTLGNAQQVNTTGGERFHNWRIEKTGTAYVTLANDLTVVNNLNLSGAATNARLDLGGRTLELLNPAAGAITGSYNAGRHIRSEQVDGTSLVRWHIGTNTGAHNIPFGGVSALGSANGIRILNFHLTTGDAGAVSVSTYGTLADNLPLPTGVGDINNALWPAPDNADATVDRFWTVNTTGSPIATLTFRYLSAELPPVPFNATAGLRAQRWDNTIPSWLPPDPGQEAGNGYVTITNVSSFGTWALAAESSPLPIELLHFGATPRANHVDLRWSTASERDNAYFTVLRSRDGAHYTPLLHTDAAGNSSTVQAYTAVDPSPYQGLGYYKLRQTDLDGSSSESAAVAVYFEGTTTLTVWPNPASDVLLVSGVQGTARTLLLMDAAGRTVRSMLHPGTDGTGTLSLTGLPAGKYMLISELGDPRAVQVIKQ